MIKVLFGSAALLALALIITMLVLTENQSMQPRTSGSQEKQAASDLRETTETAITSVRETTPTPESMEPRPGDVTIYYGGPPSSFTFNGKLYQEIDSTEPHPQLKDLIDTGEKVNDPNWPEDFGKKLYIRRGKSLSEEAWIIAKGVPRHFDPDRNMWVEAGDDEAMGFLPVQSGTH